MRILLIEDDRELCRALQISLEKEGYQTDCCPDGTEALYYALLPAYDLIILDRMLPGIDGLSILKMLRGSHISTPVILATAIGSVSERIQGLDCGADDYIVKPYDVGELLARIRALTRRPHSAESDGQLRYKDLTYDEQTHQLSCGSRTCVLTGRESLLMETFLRNPDKTLPRAMLYTRIWGPDGEVEDGNLDTYIYYARKSMKKLNSQLQIRTVFGVGYRLSPKEECPC